MNFKFDEEGWKFGRVSIRWAEMGSLNLRHQEQVSCTKDIETMGQLLGCSGFDDDALKHFIEKVCGWGCYDGIAGRVLQDNKIEDIQKAFKEAWGATDPEKAMRSLLRVNGFGVSFASKHLRMLRPIDFGVLDSRLWRVSGEKGKPEPKSYAAFCRGMKLVASKYKATQWGENEPLWRAADVEMALFAKVSWPQVA